MDRALGNMRDKPFRASMQYTYFENNDQLIVNQFSCLGPNLSPFDTSPAARKHCH